MPKRVSILVVLWLYRRAGQFRYNEYGPGSGNIWLDDLYCVGTELNIFYCTHSNWSDHNCVHAEDVSISCFPDLISDQIYPRKYQICLFPSCTSCTVVTTILLVTGPYTWRVGCTIPTVVTIYRDSKFHDSRLLSPRWRYNRGSHDTIKRHK